MKKLILIIVFVQAIIFIFGTSGFAQKSMYSSYPLPYKIIEKLSEKKDALCRVSNNFNGDTIQKIVSINEDIRELCLLYKINQLYNESFKKESSLSYNEKETVIAQLSKDMDDVFHHVKDCSIGKLIREFTKQIIKDDYFKVNDTTLECMIQIEIKCGE